MPNSTLFRHAQRGPGGPLPRAGTPPHRPVPAILDEQVIHRHTPDRHSRFCFSLFAAPVEGWMLGITCPVHTHNFISELKSLLSSFPKSPFARPSPRGTLEAPSSPILRGMSRPRIAAREQRAAAGRAAGVAEKRAFGASCAVCPGRALTRFALLRAATAGRRCVLGEPLSPRASSGGRRGRAAAARRKSGFVLPILSGLWHFVGAQHASQLSGKGGEAGLIGPGDGSFLGKAFVSAGGGEVDRSRGNPAPNGRPGNRFPSPEGAGRGHPSHGQGVPGQQRR
jgi:hypothetical protein